MSANIATGHQHSKDDSEADHSCPTRSCLSLLQRQQLHPHRTQDRMWQQRGSKHARSGRYVRGRPAGQRHRHGRGRRRLPRKVHVRRGRGINYGLRWTQPPSEAWGDHHILLSIHSLSRVTFRNLMHRAISRLATIHRAVCLWMVGNDRPFDASDHRTTEGVANLAVWNSTQDKTAY